MNRLIVAAVASGLTVGCWEVVYFDPDKFPEDPPNLASAETDAGPLSSTTAFQPGPQKPAEGEPVSAAASTVPPEETPAVFKSQETEVVVEEVVLSEPSPEDSAPDDPSLSSHAPTIWKMASRWSLAIAIHAKGLSADKYGATLLEATRAAEELGN